MRIALIILVAGFIAVPSCVSSTRNPPEPGPPLAPLPPAWDSAGTGGILGIVTDRDGRVLPHANVFVHALGGGEHVVEGQPGWMNVDSTGTFAFVRLAPGAYLVAARLIGHRMCQVNATVAAWHADTIRMRLDTMSLVFDGQPDTLPMPADYCVRSRLPR